jgi:glycosyl transferase family 87
MIPERDSSTRVRTRQEAAVDPRIRNFTPGLVLSAVLLLIYGGLAVSMDFPDAGGGFKSDEATYYMMGHSLAKDGDLTYRRRDLVRVWNEFPSGPTGAFLKKGRATSDFGLMLRPPFFWRTTADDPDTSRLYFGKSFIYPLLAAPFVLVFGTNGFFVLNALLLALAAWLSYLVLHARTSSGVATLLAAAFVMATVIPVYFVFIMPELLNFTLGLAAYFCWLYKEIEDPAKAPRAMRRAFKPSSDLLAALLLGLATFSKISNALLFPPIFLWLAWKRRWTHAAAAAMTFTAVAAGLFAINMAISGEWNYQGGHDRNTFVFEFPFQTPESGFDVGLEKERNEALTEIIFNRSVFLTNLVHNFGWYFVGRYSGLIAYFFPAVFALAFFIARPRRRPPWQYLVWVAILAQVLLFIIATPYTWFGGGGSVGNRYFIGAYGLVLFLLPPLSRMWVAVIPWAVGALFMAKLVLNPFTTAIRPGEYADAGPLRWLPVELSNINDLPINTNPARVRIWFGDNPGIGDPGFQIYFVDRNAYREGDKSFWVKGRSRVEILIKADRPMKRLVLILSGAAVRTTVAARVEGRSQEITLQPGESQRLVFALGQGYPYEGRWIWRASLSSSDGFVPLFMGGGDDPRFLGVNVKPMVELAVSPPSSRESRPFDGAQGRPEPVEGRAPSPGSKP